MSAHWHVGHNTPGYLPESDPYTVETKEDAVLAIRADAEYQAEGSGVARSSELGALTPRRDPMPAPWRDRHGMTSSHRTKMEAQMQMHCEHRDNLDAAACGKPARERDYVTHYRTLCAYHHGSWARKMSAIPVDIGSFHVIADILGYGPRSVR